MSVPSLHCPQIVIVIVIAIVIVIIVIFCAGL